MGFEFCVLKYLKYNFVEVRAVANNSNKNVLRKREKLLYMALRCLTYLETKHACIVGCGCLKRHRTPTTHARFLLVHKFCPPCRKMSHVLRILADLV